MLSIQATGERIASAIALERIAVGFDLYVWQGIPESVRAYMLILDLLQYPGMFLESGIGDVLSATGKISGGGIDIVLEIDDDGVGKALFGTFILTEHLRELDLHRTGISM